MTLNHDTDHELQALLETLLDGQLTIEQEDRLSDLLRGNSKHQQAYLNCCWIDGLLRRGIGSDFPSTIAHDNHQYIMQIVQSAYGSLGEHASSLTLNSSVFYGVFGYISSGWPVAYLIATVIFVVGAIVGSFVCVSSPADIALDTGVHVGSTPERKSEIVGHITGMVDCKWAGVAVDSSGVALGQKYALASGLMEITYDTGAKVILQGPVAYEVDSKNGGFMSVGKLTGKATTVAARGLTIRTPTATVTDLGTEFGVEVDKGGVTQSHVFRGSIRVQMAGSGSNAVGESRILHENESARVDHRGIDFPTVAATSVRPAQFVREISKPQIKKLDLVDVLAGGDGFSGKRGRGIDPTNGRPTNSPPRVAPVGDHKYHCAEGLSFIDGVFIPDGGSRPVQITSTGRVFAEFPRTSNTGSNHIWAGGAVLHPYEAPLPSKLGDVDYAVPGHGLIFMHANSGVTFDLAAIRRANPSCKLVQFRAIAGNTETETARGTESCRADVWVIVDGRLRCRRCEINGTNGAFSVVVPFHEKDRFLTLASTDGGDGIRYDYIMFGDPQIEMLVIEPKDEPNERQVK